MSQDRNPVFSTQSHLNETSTIKESAFKPLSQIKRQRKQVESDAKLLANRIALLKQEEIKTYKKIDETKKKAYEIYQLKVANNERIKQVFSHQIAILLLQRKIQKERNLFVIKERKKLKQEQNLEEKRQKLEQFNQMKRMHTDEVKKLKEVNRVKKQQQVLKIAEEMKLRNQLIRKQEELGKQRIQEYQITKQKFYQDQYLRTYSIEEQAKKFKEMEILKMEKLEAELIQKLQQSQVYQKEAYEQLENALSLQPELFEERYIKTEKNEDSKVGEQQKSEPAFLTEQGNDNKESLKNQNQEGNDNKESIKDQNQGGNDKNQAKTKTEQNILEKPKEMDEQLNLQQEEPKQKQQIIKVSGFESQLHQLTESLGLLKQYIQIVYAQKKQTTEINEEKGDNLKWNKVVEMKYENEISDLIIKLFAEINSETSLVGEGTINLNQIKSETQQLEINLENKEKQSVGKIIFNAILEEC